MCKNPRFFLLMKTAGHRVETPFALVDGAEIRVTQLMPSSPHRVLPFAYDGDDQASV